ncbi:hypothetical protein [Micromonospora sp. HM5-17]|jgi:hypothetical protein|uniref:hypothetical protein n=1 Tax=Micromonospora sp. HM5-17 TaxID=2487710 RepID=UPI00131574A6|nr:hypothetical protein [Micromonospora sp. HM5-17]
MAPTIYPTDRADAKALARRLLDAAGAERHDEVRTVSDGPLGLGFDVPEDLAVKVLGVEGFDVGEDEPGAAGERQAAEAAGEKTSARVGAGESEASAAGGGSSAPSKASRARAGRST